ncbi:SAM-dependent methyltransferase [bacterium]|nr:SAM-dependent methyltransferase [bacterium]
MTLYLLPNLLAEDGEISLSIPAGVEEILYELDGFFVETPKVARKFLKHFDFDRLRDKPMEVIDRKSEDFSEHLKLLKSGSYGLLSDCGLPCIADPGARLVYLAKNEGILVEAIPGPSSIFLALMLSGLYSQKFTFYGYMPRQMDGGLRRDRSLQVYIQTPYKTETTLQNLMDILEPRDMLCVALDLGSKQQQVLTHSVKQWKKMQWPDLKKRPAVFLIQTRT